MKSSDRHPVLDGLRAISILLVLAAHMLPLGPKPFQLNWAAGAMGMSLFFALSGFLIATLLLHNPDVVEFTAKRLGRILPLAYAYLLFACVLLHWDPSALLWTASFLVNYMPSEFNGYNGHLWSLCVEVQFYAAIALAVLLGGRKAIWVVWPACLIVTAMRISESAYIHIQTHLRVDEILAGACVATIFNNSWKGRLPFQNTTVLIAVVAWFLSASPYSGWFQYMRPYASASVLAAVLCHDKTTLARILSSAAFRYIATISYALYVIHPITFHGWFNQGSTFERYFLKRPISFAMTFVAAHLSTFYWERPCLEMVHKWIHDRRLRRSPSIA